MVAARGRGSKADYHRLLISVEREQFRRFKARAAFENLSMSELSRRFIDQWLGNWGERPVPYTVREGDTMASIARKFYGDAKRLWGILYFNGLDEPDDITPGQELLIPEPKIQP